MQAKHAHPVAILGYLGKQAGLLFLPAARGFLAAVSGGGIMAWLQGAWIDLSVLAAILFLAVFRWLSLCYQMDRQVLILWQGLFWKTRKVIPLRQVTAISAERLWWMRPFRAEKLRVDTMAGSSRQADIILVVSYREARRMLRCRGTKSGQNALGVSALGMRYRPRAVSIAALAAVTSNSFAGILLSSAFLSILGNIVGRELGQQVYATLSRAAQLVAWLLPPVTGVLALAIVSGYLVAFCVNCLKYVGFRVRRKGSCLYVRGGFFTRRSYVVDVGSIGYIDLRQGLLTKLLRLYSAYFYCPGFGKRREEIAALIPAADWKDIAYSLKGLLREFHFCELTLRPNRGAVGKYILSPLWPCLLVPALALAGGYFFPAWSRVIFSAAVMISVPAYWFLGVRLVDFFTTGLGFDGQVLTLRYSTGYTLHTVGIPKERVAYIQLRQSPFQRFDGSCDVRIYTKGERARKHHVKNLKRETVIQLLGLERKSQ